ncbi:alpha-galactosidase [soil metagenome]
MASSISFNQEQRVFLLSMSQSFYAIRIAGDGQIMHLASGPGTLEPGSWTHLADYEYEPVWDDQCGSQEYPAFGDINYHDVAIKVTFGAIRDLRLRYRQHEITANQETLLIHLQDLSGALRVTLGYRVTQGHDVIEKWVRLENCSQEEATINSLAFGALYFPSAQWELTHAAGHWLREFVSARKTLHQGTFRLDQRGLNTGHSSTPAFLLNEPGEATEETGTVWFGALAYSGNWNMRFDLLPKGALRIFAGYEPDDFEIRLAPGDSHQTPSFLHGCSTAGRGGASRQLHRFVRDRILPGNIEATCRPVLYNSWEATAFDVNEEGQIRLARLAAGLGVELFCLDDGWFGDRTDDTKGLGDWFPRPSAFPRGLAPLAQEVKGLGMKFGLWVEPEMVNPDSDLYRAHPDWVLHFPGRPRTLSRNQLVLDFGRPEVLEYLFEALDRLVRENGVDFFKWDMNRYATEPGSVIGQAIWYTHVSRLYELIDRLRQRHPHLEIQSCSGGGGRVDLGIMGRTDQVWTSDNTDAHDRLLIQEGFSQFYPPRTMEAWVTPSPNHQTGRTSSLDLRFDVAMRGALGLGLALDRLTSAERDYCRRKIAFYKNIRSVVQHGDLYRIGHSPERTGLSIWLFVSKSQRQAVYSFVRLTHAQGHHSGPVRLRGLIPNLMYTIYDDRGNGLSSFSGAQLMFLGLSGDCRNGGLGNAESSRTLFLNAVNSTKLIENNL